MSLHRYNCEQRKAEWECVRTALQTPKSVNKEGQEMLCASKYWISRLGLQRLQSNLLVKIGQVCMAESSAYKGMETAGFLSNLPHPDTHGKKKYCKFNLIKNHFLSSIECSLPLFLPLFASEKSQAPVSLHLLLLLLVTHEESKTCLKCSLLKFEQI